ncbi:MAG TPA: hypothetical protein VIU11_11050, partial [Nakamurella sp.]
VGRWRRPVLPDALRASLTQDERILVAAPCQDGRVLAVSRFGLWVVSDPGGPAAHAARIGWESIARATLLAGVLSVVTTTVTGQLPDGTDILVDEPELVFALAGRSGLTDLVHNRVHRSVAASRHLPYPGAGGWVVLRRVPGRDGLTRQVWLDTGADIGVPGFADAVRSVADELDVTMPT